MIININWNFIRFYLKFIQIKTLFHYIFIIRIDLTFNTIIIIIIINFINFHYDLIFWKIIN